MSDRFFSTTPIKADRITLDGPEAHHLLHVMRASVGDNVTLFDDSGAEFTAVVETLRRSEADLRVVDTRKLDRELPFTLSVGVALPKGDRQKWLVEKLTELGATELAPLETERGVAQPTAAAIERLQRAGIEAAKQCGRNRLMTVAQPQAWDEWLTAGCLGQSASDAPDRRRLLAHPGAAPLAQCDLTTPLPTQLAIGPEGGLTNDEVAAATEAGWQVVDLGPRILRVETAAIALAAAVSLR